jgi:hypothetical protein
MSLRVFVLEPEFQKRELANLDDLLTQIDVNEVSIFSVNSDVGQTLPYGNSDSVGLEDIRLSLDQMQQRVSQWCLGLGNLEQFTREMYTIGFSRGDWDNRPPANHVDITNGFQTFYTTSDFNSTNVLVTERSIDFSENAPSNSIGIEEEFDTLSLTYDQLSELGALKETKVPGIKEVDLEKLKHTFGKDEFSFSYDSGLAITKGTPIHTVPQNSRKGNGVEASKVNRRPVLTHTMS